MRRGRSMYTSVSAAAKRSHAEGTQPKPSMTHWSRLRRSAWIFRYSSWGTLPPPALNWMASSGYSGSPVISARRLASMDFPPPAFPNTATFLTRSFAVWPRRGGTPRLSEPGSGTRSSSTGHRPPQVTLGRLLSITRGGRERKNPQRSIAQGPRWGGSGEQVREQLAELWRASERLAERSEIALIDDQRHALKAAAVIVGAEADLVRALCLALRELQELDGRPVIGRLDLRFLFDDTAAPME